MEKVTNKKEAVEKAKEIKSEKLNKLNVLKEILMEKYKFPIKQVELIDGRFPHLSDYENEVLKDSLHKGIATFTRNRLKSGNYSYTMTYQICSNFNEEFKSNLFGNRRNSYFEIDEAYYQFIHDMRKVGASDYDNFTIRCRDRLSVGYSKDNRPYLVLEVLIGFSPFDNKPVVISKILSGKRFLNLGLNPSWFKGENAISVYLRQNNDDEETEEISTDILDF